MVARVLIANRGEIARRIIRSCRSLDIAAVAVYSEADAGLAHVAEADAAVAIGPAPARQSYLVTDTILDAAARAGADAIHPGYGFLSENAGFARAVIGAGLKWIGPAPDTVEAMGDKQRAREIAIAADVPVVPGSRRLDENDAAGTEAEAASIGYPLLVKAAGGGGGIGMKRVDRPEDLLATVEATRSMAGKAFGDDTVFLERYIGRARHVEVQVFGLGDGHAIHLFERDCSLQRRFQKVIEESPAPNLDDELRTRLAHAAVRLSRAVNYASAGTVEFIVDVDSGDFYFLEMNTRIQVEHPVTEMVTGTDLVAMQIELAAGRLDRLEQDDIKLHGAAIECRLYAENPARMFLPSPGPLTRFRLPADGDGLRIDSGYQEGDLVTPHYDPMIAKVIAWGDDRESARQRAASAIRQIEIEGLKTNRDFLVGCLEHAEFRAGNVHTGFIDVHGKALTAA